MSFQEWLDQGNAPHGTEDAADLARTLRGDSLGAYKSQPKRDGMRLVTGPGEKAFLFHESTADKHIAALKTLYLSEPGASWEGDIAFQRGLDRKD